MKNKTALLTVICLWTMAFYSCQKMDRPEYGDYLKDSNPPGGPLNFYVAFDGTGSDVLKNVVDSIRASFPSDNPLTAVDGISGKGVKGVSGKFIKYAKPNDWAVQAKSFTVAFWAKGDGQTRNNSGTNGPEHIFSFGSVHGANDWPNTTMLFFEGNNTACAIKFYVYSRTGDKWFVWEGGNMIAGIRDNTWRHYSFSYNASTSTMTLYINGAANPNLSIWAGHGDINIDDSKITELRIGRGPRNDSDVDGAGGWVQSSWKGEIDQFRMYSKALTAAEVSALYASKL
jgi:hypothetical protein